MIYSDAEPGLTSNQTQSWLKRQKNIAHNITLIHAPVAERMIGYTKNHMVHAIRGTNKRWWEVVDAVVEYYNENHVSRNTLMTPKDAEKIKLPSASEDGTGEHQKNRQPATSNRSRGQGQGHRQEEVRERLHAGLERRVLRRRERIKRARRCPSHAHIVSTYN